MTYQEKYSELHSKYETAGKELESAIKNLSEINGFGDLNDIEHYSKTLKNFEFYQKQFQHLLKYISEGQIDPKTEFINCEYMYGFIRKDQVDKGTEWKEFELYPGQSKKESEFYSCEIGLTNDGEIKKDYQRDIYKFPVLNLNHGKECYAFLSGKLQFNPKQEFDVNDWDFSKVIDETKPIFVKVIMRTK